MRDIISRLGIRDDKVNSDDDNNVIVIKIDLKILLYVYYKIFSNKSSAYNYKKLFKDFVKL